MSMTPSQSIATLEQWFCKNCDRHWENFYGIKIESTDNPGWIVTVSGSAVDEEILSSMIGDLLKDLRAQCSYDESSIRVFSPTLLESLSATARLLEEGGFGKSKLGAPK